MIICPYCDAENIEGSDQCDQCHHSLSDLSLPVPVSQVEADLLRDRVNALPPKKPTTVSSAAKVVAVLQKMAGDSIGCVLVVDDGKLVGIFSERDAVMRIGVDHVRLADHPVSEFMTKNPETIELNDRIAFALHKMDIGSYRHLPVMENGNLVGVISVRDILAYLTARIGVP